jgi:hypothetical protein
VSPLLLLLHGLLLLAGLSGLFVAYAPELVTGSWCASMSMACCSWSCEGASSNCCQLSPLLDAWRWDHQGWMPNPGMILLPGCSSRS